MSFLVVNLYEADIRALDILCYALDTERDILIATAIRSLEASDYAKEFTKRVNNNDKKRTRLELSVKKAIKAKIAADYDAEAARIAIAAYKKNAGSIEKKSPKSRSRKKRTDK